MEQQFTEDPNKDKTSPCTVKTKPYCSKELCTMYEVTYKTFRGWLKPHLEELGARNGRYYTVLQVRIIFKKLGAPEIYKE